MFFLNQQLKIKNQDIKKVKSLKDFERSVLLWKKVNQNSRIWNIKKLMENKNNNRVLIMLAIKTIRNN